MVVAMILTKIYDLCQMSFHFAPVLVDAVNHTLKLPSRTIPQIVPLKKKFDQSLVLIFSPPDYPLIILPTLVAHRI